MTEKNKKPDTKKAKQIPMRKIVLPSVILLAILVLLGVFAHFILLPARKIGRASW